MKCVLLVLSLLLLVPTVAMADSLTVGNVRGVKYDKMNRIVGGHVVAEIAYELTSRGSGKIFLMGGCGGGKSVSLGSAVVSRGSGVITIEGSNDDWCYRNISAQWGF